MIFVNAFFYQTLWLLQVKYYSQTIKSSELSKEVASSGFSEEIARQMSKPPSDQQNPSPSKTKLNTKSVTHIHPELTLEQVQKGSLVTSSRLKKVDSNEELEINTMFDLHSKWGLK